MLKLTQQEFETVPLIIKIEILIAAVTCMWGTNTATVHSIAMPKFGKTAVYAVYAVSAGSLIVSGDFKPVSALKNQRQEHAFAQLQTCCYFTVGRPQTVSCCRGLDANTLRVDFMSINHRGQVMPMVAPAIK